MRLEEIKAHPVHGKRYRRIGEEITRLDTEHERISRILERQGMDVLDEEGNRLDERAYQLQRTRNSLVREVRALYRL